MIWSSDGWTNDGILIKNSSWADKSYSIVSSPGQLSLGSNNSWKLPCMVFGNFTEIIYWSEEIYIWCYIIYDMKNVRILYLIESIKNITHIRIPIYVFPCIEDSSILSFTLWLICDKCVEIACNCWFYSCFKLTVILNKLSN